MWKKLGVAVLPVLAVTAVILGEDVEHKSGRMFIGSVVDGMAVVPIGDLPERGVCDRTILSVSCVKH